MTSRNRYESIWLYVKSFYARKTLNISSTLNFKAYRSLKKFLSISLALGISCERRVFAPVIANSLKVSSLITAKLLLRRKLHVSLVGLLLT